MKMDISRQLVTGLLVLGCVGSVLVAGCVVGPKIGNEETASRLDRSLYQAAQTFEQRQDYATAVRYYRKLYQRDAKVVKAVVGLSSGLRHLQQSREAQAIVIRALKDAPKDVNLRAEQGKIQLALGEPLKAIETLSLVDTEIR